jgi:hypothetical protein
MRINLVIALVSATSAGIAFAPECEALTSIPPVGSVNSKGSALTTALAGPADLAGARVEKAQANWHWSTREKRDEHYWRQRQYWRRYK